MTAPNKIQMRSKGSLTMPIELRRKYSLDEGDVFTLIDLGEGDFLLTSKATQVDRLGNRVADILAQQDVSVEEVLQALDEERRQYYQERYAPHP